MIEISRILVPIDFSDYSQKAARHGIEMGKSLNARIYFVHVINQRIIDTLKDLNLKGYKGDFLKALRELINDRDEDLIRFVPREWREGIEAEFLVRKGNVAEEILKVAQELSVELIVIGSQGHSALTSFFTGSVARKIVDHSPCPVLVVRPTERVAAEDVNLTNDRSGKEDQTA